MALGIDPMALDGRNLGRAQLSVSPGDAKKAGGGTGLDGNSRGLPESAV